MSGNRRDECLAAEGGVQETDSGLVQERVPWLLSEVGGSLCCGGEPRDDLHRGVGHEVHKYRSGKTPAERLHSGPPSPAYGFSHRFLDRSGGGGVYVGGTGGFSRLRHNHRTDDVRGTGGGQRSVPGQPGATTAVAG